VRNFALLVLVLASILPQLASAAGSDCVEARGFKSRADDDYKKALGEYNRSPNEGEAAVKKAKKNLDHAKQQQDYWQNAVDAICAVPHVGF
jgi:hypothetical protein